jgi:uncharacterized membrane protein (DUF2068 family)
MDWNLYRCGRAGHITYAPDEPAIREHVRAQTARGDLWQCLRCGTYVAGPALGSGPAEKAPVLRRGKEIRSEIILRVFAIERFIRFLIFGALAYGVYRFGQSQQTLQHAFNHEFPIFRSLFRQLGFNINHSSIVVEFQKALHLSPAKIHLFAVGLGVVAVVELVEGVGLWLAKRWGEYFAVVVTAAGLPLEISELLKTVTATKAILFVLNLALVLYLILTKRLFGARGGGRAYEARLRSESIFDAITEATPGQYPADAGGVVRASDADAGGAHDVAEAGGDDAAGSGGARSAAGQILPPVPPVPIASADPTLRKTPPDAESD